MTGIRATGKYDDILQDSEETGWKEMLSEIAH